MLATYFGGSATIWRPRPTCRCTACISTWSARPSSSTPCWQRARPDLVLSLGVIDGRNVWRPISTRCSTGSSRWSRRGRDRDPRAVLLAAARAVDLALETALDPEVTQWLAFAVQKIERAGVLAKALNEGRDSVASALDASAPRWKRAGPRRDP
jgi:5-methyltetrahydropteroyltriglutamate--homocysteine methyltransferase